LAKISEPGAPPVPNPMAATDGKSQMK